MRALSAQEIIAVWETGQRQHSPDKALTLLAAACPESTRAELAALSIGARDRRLLDVRERTFGSILNGFAECPQCGDRCEFRWQVSDIRTAPEPDVQPLQLAAEDLLMRFRLPTSCDLADVATASDRQAGLQILVRRCLLEASRNGEPVEVTELPATVFEDLSRSMAENDPQAEVLLELQCPTCAHRWQGLFDIATFFWRELAAQARGLLREVDALARAYHWREADILSLSASRRQAYLELIGA